MHLYVGTAKFSCGASRGTSSYMEVGVHLFPGMKFVVSYDAHIKLAFGRDAYVRQHIPSMECNIDGPKVIFFFFLRSVLIGMKEWSQMDCYTDSSALLYRLYFDKVGGKSYHACLHRPRCFPRLLWVIDTSTHGCDPTKRLLQRGQALEIAKDHHFHLGTLSAEELGVVARQSHTWKG